MITTFSNILGALNAHLNVTDAFPEVAVGLRRLTGCDQSSLSLLDETGEWFCVAGLDPPQPDLGQGTRLRVMDTPAAADLLAGRAHLVADLASERDVPLFAVLCAAGYRSCINQPLHGFQGICGTLNLSWRQPNGFQNVDLALLSHVAEAIALAVERSRLFEEVRAARRRLETLSRRLLEVQEEERRHLARELHDEVGQVLTALKFSLDGIDSTSSPTVPFHSSEARSLLDLLIARVRNLSLDLRPAMLDDLGLLPALLWSFERLALLTNVDVHFEHHGLERRFSSAVETAAYRIVQEALTNVVRHAGVHSATVRLWVDENSLHLHIVDEGRGFTSTTLPDTTGGLLGMQERTHLLDGQLTVESAPGKGTRIHAELPLGAPTASRQH